MHKKQNLLQILDSLKEKIELEKSISKPNKIYFNKYETSHINISENTRSITGSMRQIEKFDYSNCYNSFQNKHTTTELKENFKNNFDDKTQKKIAGRFLESYIWDCFQNVSKQILSQKYLQFQKDLDLQPVTYKAICEVAGLYINAPSISFNIGIIKISLRSVKLEDFNYETTYNSTILTNRSGKTSILSISSEKINPEKLIEIAYNLIDIFSLYKTGTIYLETLLIESNSFQYDNIGKIGTYPNSDLNPNNGYTINKNEKITFTNFCKLMFPIFHSNLNDNKKTYLQIGFDRYKYFLYRKSNFDAHLATIVMGLEALLLAGDEKSELTYRLKLRCVKIATLLGYNYTELSKAIQIAYGIRSAYVHGSKSSLSDLKKVLPNNQGNISAIFENYISNLFRKLLIFLNLIELDKLQLIKLIDSSFINPKDNQKLKNITKKTKTKLFNHEPLFLEPSA
ncbi:HEPN domain-containing protein [Leptospira bandrabouensis]|uniref:HEPN domain-containing protein n=1 Tax=Leptospira bandrabouensis TaxID=2484903 RepID=UPI00223D3E14|nr:HEPN domain-containing protein [Leptospira bandrabouensis]MCW7460431.1 HEPN domain-containing protein [Leptospira bandrabouensis]MCW7479381.1 HEPN domain-containing protein [Leptospira bandrabouensis]MCW7487039.1 HEPN domain-containing protein [Leptospira bandrabouensis]